MNIAAIILARGGSKGIPNKNIIDFCGKPLIEWTIKNCKDAGINNIYISSDSDKILSVGEQYGTHCIKRPSNISGDEATSESGWLHALEVAESNNEKIDWILAPQVTSPLRTSNDISKGLKIAAYGDYDSLFSCSVVEDLFFWERKNGKLNSINYNWRNRKRRQDTP